MERLLLNAKIWARGLWSEAAKSWEDRNQDHNYRDLLARPGLAERIRELPSYNNGKFLDVGCGEGNETIHLCKVLSKNGSTGRMYGFDTQKSFVNGASKLEGQDIHCTFGGGDLSYFLQENGLVGNVDLVTSLFVLQNLPGIHEHIYSTGQALRKGGTALFLLVHPEFGEAMRKKKAAKVNKQLSPSIMSNHHVNWLFAAEYPIVEENEKTFYVPYFQRSEYKYKELFEEYGFKHLECFGLKPDEEVIERAEKEKLSPFYNHEGNIYYPEIVKRESSLIIRARK